jgi:multidrug efflux pump
MAYVEIDRATASRLGITPAAIDNALYNAFGQRLVSTIFTQTNQYRVVLEVKPEFQRGPGALENLHSPPTCRGQTAQQVPLSTVARVVEKGRAARDQPYRPVPGRDRVVQPRARRGRWATR